jgi:hypothetical protein
VTLAATVRHETIEVEVEVTFIERGASAGPRAEDDVALQPVRRLLAQRGRALLISHAAGDGGLRLAFSLPLAS